MSKKRDQLEKRLHTAMAAYLREVGWKPVVSGGMRIRERSMPFLYTFEIDFTGSRGQTVAQTVAEEERK